MNDEPKTIEQDNNGEEKHMTFLEHLEELRIRLLISIATVGGVTLLCFFFANSLLGCINGLIGNSLELHTSSFGETFSALFKVSVIAGVFIGFPVVMFQLWRFISPGLYGHEKKHLLPFIVSAWLCFILGGTFGFFILVPFMLKMMVAWTPESLQNTWFISQYITLVLMLLVACGLLFDMPLVILLLAKLGLVNPRTLGKYRGYALLVSFVVGAVLSPPDVLSQMILAVPMYILYEISILLCRILGYGSKT